MSVEIQDGTSRWRVEDIRQTNASSSKVEFQDYTAAGAVVPEASAALAQIVSGASLPEILSGVKAFLKRTITEDSVIDNLQTQNAKKPLSSKQGYNLDQKLLNLTYANSGAHNSIYRGKDLTNVYSIEEICQRASNGLFTDLYIGDYITKEITSTLGGTETVDLVIAGFDVFLLDGDTSLSKHHIVLVPRDCFKTKAAMNSTNVTTGGYKGSAMWTTVLPAYNTAFANLFGTHLIKYRTLITKAVGTTVSAGNSAWTGNASDWEWIDCQLSLMSEAQVYGANVFSSSGYDTGIDNMQFPIFSLDPKFKHAGLGKGGDRMWYWLKNVVSSTYFAHVANDGASTDSNASDANGVRPFMLIG